MAVITRREFVTQSASGIFLLLLPLQSSAHVPINPSAMLYVRLPAHVQQNMSLVAEVMATGTGYLSSDLRNSTSQITFSSGPGGLARVDLGTVRTAGCYSFVVRNGNDHYAAVLFLAPTANPSTFEVIPLEVSATPLSSSFATTVQRGFEILRREFTTTRLLRAAREAGTDPVTVSLPNTLASGTVIIMGFVLLAGPLAAAAGTTAIVASVIGKEVLSTGAEFFIDNGLNWYSKYVELLAREGKLTAQERGALLTLGAAAGGISTVPLALISGRGGKVAQALRGAGYLEQAVPQSTNPQAAQIIYGSTAGLTSRSAALLKFVKP